jgi:dTDP-4-amino-4,6-dideoxygalactose transaminase
MTERIPLVNLARQHAEIRGELVAALEGVLDSGAFILGPAVARFEEEFAAVAGSRHAVGCANGTAAISLALEAIGVGRGDEVVTTPHTFAATAEAIVHVGATPVFVDIEPDTYGIDPAHAAAAIGSRTRAVLPVHVYGAPCRIGEVMAIADQAALAVVEDSAQAHLAAVAGRRVGTFGRAGTFSFYPGKNLGACGDAGAVITGDVALADGIRRLRDHGRSSKYEHVVVGYNHRMDGLQAAVLSTKLRRLEDWTARRVALARRYDAVLAERFHVVRPREGDRAVYHLYVVEVSNRDAVQAALAERGIATGVHYPIPLHRQPAFARWAGGALPVAERTASRVLSLPLCAHLQDAEQDEVLDRFLAIAAP